jgi:SAM-dependent methyltransferase
MKILDIGCGKNKFKPYNPKDVVIGLDKHKLEGVDVVHDLEETPYPFEENEFDEICAHHVLEHIQNFFGLMEECHRILKPGGKFKIWAPYGLASLGLPDHKRFLMFKTFDCFVPGHFENYYTKARFKIVKKHLNFTGSNKILNFIFNPLINLNHKLSESILRRVLPISEMYIELECIKT